MGARQAAVAEPAAAAAFASGAAMAVVQGAQQHRRRAQGRMRGARREASRGHAASRPQAAVPLPAAAQVNGQPEPGPRGAPAARASIHTECAFPAVIGVGNAFGQK